MDQTQTPSAPPMGLLEKLKLLFKARQPLTDIITEVKQVKAGWKTWPFWITVLGSIGALVASLNGLIPATVIVSVTVGVAFLTSVYNLVRGAIKSQVPGQKPYFQTSEFWASVIGCVTAAIVGLQSGGINPAVFKTALTAIGVIMGTLGAGQNLSGQQPGAISTDTAASVSPNVLVSPNITK